MEPMTNRILAAAIVVVVSLRTRNGVSPFQQFIFLYIVFREAGSLLRI